MNSDLLPISEINYQNDNDSDYELRVTDSESDSDTNTSLDTDNSGDRLVAESYYNPELFRTLLENDE